MLYFCPIPRKFLPGDKFYDALKLPDLPENIRNRINLFNKEVIRFMLSNTSSSSNVSKFYSEISWNFQIIILYRLSIKKILIYIKVQ